MSVISCKVARTSRQGRYFIDDNGGVSGEAIVFWYVITDDDNDGWPEVYAGAKTATPDPLPEFYDTYNVKGKTNADLFFYDVMPATQQEDKPTHWTIKGTYKNLRNGLTGTQANVNPLLRPWRFSRVIETISEPVLEAINLDTITTADGTKRPAGTLGPLVNTALQDLDTLTMQNTTRMILRAEKNFATTNEIDALQRTYQDSLNSTTFIGYPQYHCEFRGARASDVRQESGVEYHATTVEIVLSGKPLILKPVNRGFQYFARFQGGEYLLFTAKDSNDEEVAEPLILTNIGTKVGDPNNAAGVVEQQSVRYLARTNTQDYNTIFA